jgi:hypothetical protein
MPTDSYEGQWFSQEVEASDANDGSGSDRPRMDSARVTDLPSATNSFAGMIITSIVKGHQEKFTQSPELREVMQQSGVIGHVGYYPV